MNAEPPPPEVFHDVKEYWCGDGAHRIHEAKDGALFVAYAAGDALECRVRFVGQG